MLFQHVSESVGGFLSILHRIKNIASLPFRGMPTRQADPPLYLDRFSFEVELDVRGMSGLTLLKLARHAPDRVMVAAYRADGSPGGLEVTRLFCPCQNLERPLVQIPHLYQQAVTVGQILRLPGGCQGCR
jgi:hypothetical protein